VKKIWIGIDDTDSTNGGCTTYTALLIIKRLNEENIDLIGFPRLVRLNPNIPWKTRGNGAISFKIGAGKGLKTKIGEFQDKDIFCFEKNKNENLHTTQISNIIQKIIDENAKLDDKKTNTGYVINSKQFHYSIYEKTVREVVTIKETKEFLKKNDAYYKGYKNSRGLIGATASISWKPKQNKTFELITYREPQRWGTKREVDDETTKQMNEKYPTTFDNFDFENNHNRIVPSSPCPVLYGIRGTNYDELIHAKTTIKSENVHGWIIFESNQGTDEHLVEKTIKDIKKYESVIVQGSITTQPHTIKGGHVFFKITDGKNEIDCAAYEPTKQFRNIIRKLIPGDEIQAYGGVRNKPLTINLEKIKINKLEEKKIKIENPLCPNCGKHMKSKGKDQGFKCIKCGIKNNEPKTQLEKREIKKGYYEVAVCARRHLSTPIKLMNQP